MEGFLVQPTLTAFFFQALLAITPIFLSYIAYVTLRVNEEKRRTIKALSSLGPSGDSNEKRVGEEFNTRQFIVPLLLSCGLVFALYSLSHPAVLKSGFWTGIVEEVIPIFNYESVPQIYLVGRVLFWGWLGAYMYSFGLVFYRFLTYDLKPMVYVFVARRFFMAFAAGSVVTVGLGVSMANGTEAIKTDQFNNIITTVSIVSFFIGFFPDAGLDWIVEFSRKVLGQVARIANELRLTELEGMSIWQQGRFQQEGIENVQNLAAANITQLVISSPFTAGQIIDWVDQAILICYAGNLYKTLERINIRSASAYLTLLHFAKDGAIPEVYKQMINSAEMARTAERSLPALETTQLEWLYATLQSAVNMRLVLRFKWNFGTNPDYVEAAAALPSSEAQSSKTQNKSIMTAPGTLKPQPN